MKVEFDIKLQEKDLFRFNMYHSYHKVSIWIFTLLGVAIFALSFTTINEIEATYTMLYWLCGLIFIFYTPLNLKTTVKFSMKDGSPLSKTLHYEFLADGVVVNCADDGKKQTQVAPWTQIYRVVETKHQVLIYTSRVNASVLPKEQIEQLDLLKEIFKEHLPSYRLKIRK